jgi:hypothetical protein
LDSRRAQPVRCLMEHAAEAVRRKWLFTT